jgi:type I restriction enzyme R subunit
VETRDDADDPTQPSIRGKGNDTAFWDITLRQLAKAGHDGEVLAVDIAAASAAIVSRHRTVGGQNDRDAQTQNRIRNDIDAFFDEVIGRNGFGMDPSTIDAIVDEILASARVRMKDDGRMR